MLLPSLSNGSGPLVKRCNGFDGSSWSIQDGYESFSLAVSDKKDPFYGLYIFYTRSQGITALVSVSDDKIQITILILRRGALSRVGWLSVTVKWPLRELIERVFANFWQKLHLLNLNKHIKKKYIKKLLRGGRFFPNVFNNQQRFSFANCVCPNYQIYLSKL